jgi:hypothetical protein
LENRGFIYTSHYGEGPHYSLAPDGAGWLIEHGAMPD